MVIDLLDSLFTQLGMGFLSFFIIMIASLVIGFGFALVCSYKSKSY